MSDRGIVYVATKHDRYVEEAFLSATSIKQLAPHLHISLFTDRPNNSLCGSGAFDNVVAIEGVHGFKQDWAEGQLDRLQSLLKSPYRLTLNLDTDTRVFSAEIADLFHLLDSCDVAMVEDPLSCSYACKHSGRRMYNAGLILFRRTPDTERWLCQWDERIRRNFTLALQDDVPRPPELAHVMDDEVRRQLLRIDQIALMEMLSPDRNEVGLVFAELNKYWNYRGVLQDIVNFPEIKILHSDDYKAVTKADILGLAFTHRRNGKEKQAQQLYDYVGEAYPPIIRETWLSRLGLKAAAKTREEWATILLKSADLHLQQRQFKLAAETLAVLAASSNEPRVQAGQARALLGIGDASEALKYAERAAHQRPKSAYINLVYGQCLLAVGRTEDAISKLSLAGKAGYQVAWKELGRAHFSLQNYVQAAAFYQKAIVSDPQDVVSSNNLLPALLGSRDYKAAIREANVTLGKKNQIYTSALAFKSVAMNELGLTDEWSALVDHQQLIVSTQLSYPAGYNDMRHFHQAVSSAIATDPSLAYEPRANTTHVGYQTGDLSQSTSAPIQQLNAMILGAVQTYMDNPDVDTAHPYWSARPRVSQYLSWGVILENGGFQTPHIHAKGWMSGVYYVEVPDDITADDPAMNGWLEFGPSEERWYRPGTKTQTTRFFPQAGVLVMFPSYFWHSVRQHNATKRRISFAFDIMPR